MQIMLRHNVYESPEGQVSKHFCSGYLYFKSDLNNILSCLYHKKKVFFFHLWKFFSEDFFLIEKKILLNFFSHLVWEM